MTQQTFTQREIKFRPNKDIVKTRNGQKNLHFFSNKTYIGVRYVDGSIAAYSPICNRTIFLNEKHIEIIVD